MVCTTVKNGVECFFMSKNGCQFNGGRCNPIVDACNGCQKAKEFTAGAGKYCLIFPEPGTKWRAGKCNMATHVEKAAAKEVQKVNPLKASKRAAK